LAPAPEGCYLTSTPNAYDAPRALHTRIDRPAQVSGINEYNMYKEPGLLNYHAGNHYHGYPNNAAVTYYVDDSISAPFSEPNFSARGTKTYSEDYTDPMGTWKPHYFYYRQHPENVSPLSWINDSTFFREDLMSRQMAVMNQSRSEPLL
jgi:hypothetical protein